MLAFLIKFVHINSRILNPQLLPKVGDFLFFNQSLTPLINTFINHTATLDTEEYPIRYYATLWFGRQS
ncbi:MAG: hypothetical protein EAZ77_09095 [Nostocales cyanobacterium]|nr:MAG: hypothetical protein EAZ77_09095 [Nostocales cyanobacterium]